MNILIPDDEATNRKLLRALFEAEGHLVFDCEDGLAALHILNQMKIDAIVSDILMPRMDGYRLCQEVRADPRFRHLPFIVYTSTYTTPSDEKLAVRVGADKFIRKPAPSRVLLQALDELWSNPRPETNLPGSPPLVRSVMKEYNETLVRKLEKKNTELELAKSEIMKANELLEHRVAERTAELEEANEELEAFSHSAAHDLRAPMRAISGYAAILMEDHAEELGEEGMQTAFRIKEAAQRMNVLIEDLLNLSHISRAPLKSDRVDLGRLVEIAIGELRQPEPGHKVQVEIAEGATAEGDSALLYIAIQNLVGNAWKFSRRAKSPRISFSHREVAKGELCYCISDNGVGFEMEYVDRLFAPFSRLHSQSEFPGVGLGLTIVQRIIRRHGGRIWAKSTASGGATFCFTLGVISGKA